MPARRDHGWWPYLAPYGAFLILVELSNRAPEAWQAALLVLRVAVPAALLAGFAWRGRYPELRGYRLGAASLSDVGVGLAIAALWTAPFLLFPALPRGEAAEAFDPARQGSAAFVLRGVGFFAVTPFMEELFVRSFLIRYAEVWNRGADFRTLPIGRYAPLGFWVTVVWFTLSHVPWEWIVAAPTGVLFNLWLYRRRHLGATVVAHGVANGAIWLAAAVAPDRFAFFL